MKGHWFESPTADTNQSFKARGKFTWHYCWYIDCNLKNGMVYFEDGWLVKSTIMTLDAIKLTETETKSQKKLFNDVDLVAHASETNQKMLICNFPAEYFHFDFLCCL